MKSISVIMAFYNEERAIESAVLETKKALEEAGIDYEIILVDDGSKDNSRIIAAQLCADKNVKLLENIVNLNFGTATLRGMYSASKEYVIYNAADLPLNPYDIPEILEEMINDNLQMMVLERSEYKATAYRKIASKGNLLLLNILYPKLIRGTPVLNFVQCFRRDVLDEIKPYARSPIFVWPELIFRSKINGFKWKNKIVPINTTMQVRQGSFGKPHDIIWGIYETVRFKVKERHVILNKDKR